MDKLCTTCGSVGPPQKYVPGNFGTELLLWLFGILPGVCYSYWRLNATFLGCPKCRGTVLIPLDSPVAGNFLRSGGAQTTATADR